MRSHPHQSEQEKSEKRKPADDENAKEENLDKTIEDSFPASDPPSSIPDPDDKQDAA